MEIWLEVTGVVHTCLLSHIFLNISLVAFFLECFTWLDQQ